MGLLALGALVSWWVANGGAVGVRYWRIALNSGYGSDGVLNFANALHGCISIKLVLGAS